MTLDNYNEQTAAVIKPASLRQGLAAPAPQYSALALGLSLALFGAPALAEPATSPSSEEETIELDTLQIEDRTLDTNPYAETGAPYKAKVSGDSRHVKPLAETPQTISVLTQTQIQESGKSDLREILEAQPGITLGTGENGNAFGDRYIIRGHEARSDVFVDGLRDPGMTIRESFATEQVEITKGPSSTFAGRGSTGGAINSVTKQASTAYDFAKLQGGIGTDNYQRMTLDSNQVINDDTAVRANLLHSYTEVPDRGPADRERNGAALSGAYQASSKLKVVADYYHLDAKDKPDLGTYIKPNGGKPVDDIAVYAQDQDFLESQIDTGTLRLNYEVSPKTRIENATRYGVTDNGYVATGARGTTRHATDATAPGAETIRLSQHQGWQEVDYFVNSLNLFHDRELFGLKNQFITGAEFSKQRVVNGVYNINNRVASNCILPDRNGNPSADYCLLDGNGEVYSSPGSLMGRDITKGNQDSDYNIKTLSLSLMDTITFNEKWSAFAGVRLDAFDYDNTVTSNQGVSTDYSYEDKLWNYHLGAVYQLTPQGNLYLSYSTSSEINGGESDLGASCGYGGICGADPTQVTNSKPEQAENIEFGSKWNLFNNKLLLTGALFQITKKDVMESVGDDYATLGTLNTGENRVRGVEFSASGNITRNLSSQFGASFMESEVTAAYNPANVGKVLSNFADDSLFAQLRYQLTPALAVGTVVTYSSEMYAGQPDSAAAFNPDTGEYNFEVPSYTVVDLFASYTFNEQLDLLLNVGNVADEDYYVASYRSGAFTYIGDARNANLTLNYAF